jgi:hypothetical protein
LGALYYVYHWVPIVVGVVGFLAGLVLVTTGFYLAALIALGIVSLTLITVGVFAWLRATSQQSQGLNPALKLRFWRQDLAIVDRYTYRYESTIAATILQPGQQSYRHKFWWSGQGKMEVEPLSANIEHAEIFPEPLGSNQVCLLRFRTEFRKRDEIDFKYRLHMAAPRDHVKPYLSYLASAPLRNLELRVRFPVGYKGTKYKRQHFVSASSDIPQDQEEVLLAPNAQGLMKAFWDINRPRIGHRYQIEWQGEDLHFVGTAEQTAEGAIQTPTTPTSQV